MTLSGPEYESVVEGGAMVPMRDGVRLAAELGEDS